MSVLKSEPPETGLDAYGRRRIVQVVFLFPIVLGVYFLSAGRVDLPWGWAYLGAGLLSLAVGGAYVVRHNPQAINERGRPPESQKAWDKTIMTAYAPINLAVYIVAGLDARFGWSGSLPLWQHILGILVVFLQAGVTYSAMAHNKFLAQVVQVAGERGHQVATEGPYRFIRHPMYLGLILSTPALAFLLGSYWALIPACLASLLVLARTALEDRTLLAELPGYPEYARRTRYRLLPGIW